MILNSSAHLLISNTTSSESIIKLKFSLTFIDVWISILKFKDSLIQQFSLNQNFKPQNQTLIQDYISQLDICVRKMMW